MIAVLFYCKSTPTGTRIYLRAQRAREYCEAYSTGSWTSLCYYNFSVSKVFSFVNSSMPLLSSQLLHFHTYTICNKQYNASLWKGKQRTNPLSATTTLRTPTYHEGSHESRPLSHSSLQQVGLQNYHVHGQQNTRFQTLSVMGRNYMY